MAPALREEERPAMLSLVIPVYKNEGSLPALLTELAALSERISCEAVFVVDGSPDRSFEYLRDHVSEHRLRWQILALSRNFGSFSAITAGMAAGQGEFFSFLAADLQEPPALIEDFHRILTNGEADVVFGRRAGRDDPLQSRLLSHAFWTLYRKLVNGDIPDGGVDIFACNRAVRDSIVSLHEQNTSLVGLLFWVGFRRAFVDYRRRERQHGRSGWTFRRKLNYFLNSFFSFTSLPITFLSTLGVLGMSISALLALIVLAARLSGGIAVPGYTATVLTVIFFGGLNSLGLGILGEYVWRSFQNSQGRPNYLVRMSLSGNQREQSH